MAGKEFPAEANWCGATLRQYAAIKLKVPESGTEWLDEMILKSRRDDIAEKAMIGLIEGYDFELRDSTGNPRAGFDDTTDGSDPNAQTFAESLAVDAYEIADAMMNEGDK